KGHRAPRRHEIYSGCSWGCAYSASCGVGGTLSLHQASLARSVSGNPRSLGCLPTFTHCDLVALPRTHNSAASNPGARLPPGFVDESRGALPLGTLLAYAAWNSLSPFNLRRGHHEHSRTRSGKPPSSAARQLFQLHRLCTARCVSVAG